MAAAQLTAICQPMHSVHCHALYNSRMAVAGLRRKMQKDRVSGASAGDRLRSPRQESSLPREGGYPVSTLPMRANPGRRG